MVFRAEAKLQNYCATALRMQLQVDKFIIHGDGSRQNATRVQMSTRNTTNMASERWSAVLEFAALSLYLAMYLTQCIRHKNTAGNVAKTNQIRK